MHQTELNSLIGSMFEPDHKNIGNIVNQNNILSKSAYRKMIKNYKEKRKSGSKSICFQNIPKSAFIPQPLQGTQTDKNSSRNIILREEILNPSRASRKRSSRKTPVRARPMPERKKSGKRSQSRIMVDERGKSALNHNKSANFYTKRGQPTVNVRSHSPANFSGKGMKVPSSKYKPNINLSLNFPTK